MNCPECNADMEIIDYSENYDSYDSITQEWKCKCPQCKYEGTFSKYFKLLNEEWDYVE